MQVICYICSMRHICLLACIAVAATATHVTRTLDPARNLRIGRPMKGNARNLLEILPSVDTAALNSLLTTPFYESGTSVNLPEVEDDGFRITRMSNVIKNLLDVAFAARKTFGKMCSAFCGENGLSTTCCQYVTDTIKSTSEFMSDSEILANSRTDVEQLTAIVRLAAKYTNEISHVTAMVQSVPCLEERVCPLSEDACGGNMDTQFCSLVHLKQRMAAFSKSCQHNIKDMMSTTTRESRITTNSHHLSKTQAAPTKLSKFTMDVNRNLYTVARMIEGLNLILKILQSLDRESRTDNSLVTNVSVRQ